MATEIKISDEELRRNFTYAQATQLFSAGKKVDGGFIRITLPPFLATRKLKTLDVKPHSGVAQILYHARPSLAGKSTITQ